MVNGGLTETETSSDAPITIIHIYELNGRVLPEASDRPFELPSMYSVHQDRIDSIGLRVRDISVTGLACSVVRDWIDGARGIGTREHVACRMELLYARDGVAQLHLTTQHKDLDDARLFLGLLCHQRSTVTVSSQNHDELPLEEHLTRCVGTALKLGADVHQMIHLKTPASELGSDGYALVDHAGVPTALARTLAYRARPFDVAIGYRPLDTGLFTPAQLNRRRDSSCVVGRGVSALQQSERHVAAARFVVTTQLVAMHRLRAVRSELESIIGSVGPSLERHGGTALAEVAHLSERLRMLRLALSGSVSAITDGLPVPEATMDELRVNFAEALALPSLRGVTETLIETLAATVDSIHQESNAASLQARATADSRWATFVAIVSAATIPPLILLAYFGVNSDVDLTPETSIFDLSRYQVPWIAATALLVLIVIGSVIVRVMNRRERSQGHRVLVSAHRGGPGGVASQVNSLQAFAAAARAGADFVEFDVQFDADSVCVSASQTHALVIRHEEIAEPGRAYVRLEDALSTVRGLTRAHIDLKFDPPKLSSSFLDVDDGELAHTAEVMAWEAAVHALGGYGFLMTSRHVESIQILSEWRRRRNTTTACTLGLSLGHARQESTLAGAAGRLRDELFPSRISKRSGADFLAVHMTLARVRILRWGARHRIPIMVWTVNGDRQIRRRTNDSRVWAIVTDHPLTALKARESAP